MRVPFGRRCLLLLTVAAGGCGGPKPLFTAGDAPAVILDRAIAAQGGEANLQRCDIGTARYLYATPAEDFAVEEHFRLPRSFRRTMRPRRTEGATVTVVVDGERAWEKRGNEVRPLQRTELNPPVYSWANLLNLSAFRGPEVTLSVQGEANHEGQTLLVLRTRSREFGLVDLYFDPATGLLAKTVKVVPAAAPLPAGSYGTMEFSDYRDLDGVQFPFRIVLTANGKPAADITFEEVKFLDKLNDALFAEPK
jgi:hypothetical protein